MLSQNIKENIYNNETRLKLTEKTLGFCLTSYIWLFLPGFSCVHLNLLGTVQYIKQAMLNMSNNTFSEVLFKTMFLHVVHLLTIIRKSR